MRARIVSGIWILMAYLFAIGSIIATHVFRAFAVSEALAVAAFVAGIVSWLLAQATDRWIIFGASLGLLGLLLKGLFIMLGIGIEQHDMTTHLITPRNPLLVHIHHVFFNLGFLCYLVSAARSAIKFLR